MNFSIEKEKYKKYFLIFKLSYIKSDFFVVKCKKNLF